MSPAPTIQRFGASIPPEWRLHGEIPVVAGVVLILGLLVLPLPPALLDLLLATSIASSILVLLVALYANDPLDFSAFPAVLLILTLYRLSLNVSSTRLILGEGDAGQVIESFGAFVIGGNYAVGVVIFLILVGINFIVITKGASRVAEVAARFTLDAMPGRQMSIDGDLNAGLIDDEEARARRKQVNREADFYGAMDGAAKFVRGDAIAGILITVINILGGLYVGMLQREMPLAQALSEYTLLTVGDGLVTQIPALVISTAAGIMVTSSSGGERVAEAVLRQVGREEKPWWVASAFLGALGLVPGLPTLPFLALSAGAAVTAYLTTGGAGPEVGERSVQEKEEADPREESASPIRELLQVDPVEVEVGYALIPLVDADQGGDLLERIKLLRKQAAVEMGMHIPPIRIRDDVNLGANEYVVRVHGTEAGRGEVMPRLVMALDTGEVIETVEGIDTQDPSFDLPARWIPKDRQVDAEAKGYVVVTPTTVIATHLLEILKDNAAELLSRQTVREMLDALEETHPALVEDVVPEKVSLGLVHRVLQRLLGERVPIRNLVTILETLADAADGGGSKNPEALTEVVRRSLGKVIAEQHLDQDGQLRGVTLGPKLEAYLMNLLSPTRAGDADLVLEPDDLSRILGDLESLTRKHSRDGRRPPVITPPGLRVGVRRLLEPVMPSTPVVSLAELPSQLNVKSLATWEVPDAA